MVPSKMPFVVKGLGGMHTAELGSVKSLPGGSEVANGCRHGRVRPKALRAVHLLLKRLRVEALTMGLGVKFSLLVSPNIEEVFGLIQPRHETSLL